MEGQFCRGRTSGAAGFKPEVHELDLDPEGWDRRLRERSFVELLGSRR